MSGARLPNAMDPTQCLASSIVQPRAVMERNSENYQVDVTQMNISRNTICVGGTTRHDSGGQAAAPYLGTWVRQRRLGRGAYGVVFLECNVRTGMVRAVKQLSGANVAWNDREIAQMLLVKEHPNLFVDFYCWYSDQAYNVYLAMEYHPGGDLYGHVKRFGPFPEARARGIVEQILQGIFVLHDIGVMHRDIKPENILVVSANPIKIKIADFGQAKKMEGSYHSMAGTTGWAAPEIESQYYDKSGDMWSVGCVVYFLLTSLKPFDAGGTPENIKKFTFHFWPRLQQHKFQEYIDDLIPDAKPKRGDQILAKGISNTANDFLRCLILRLPSARMTAYTALEHAWICPKPPSGICQTTPLQASLENGDFRLACRLAPLDKHNTVNWEDQMLPEVAQIVLRAAAASGHRQDVERALTFIPSTYDFQPNTPKRPLKPALIGAATNGSLPIVELLFNRLGRVEKTQKILLQSCYAALEGRHYPVVTFIWQFLSKRDRAWDSQLSQYVARYGNSAIFEVAYANWKSYNPPNNPVLQKIEPGDTSTAYASHFPTILEYAAEHGNVERVRWLLKMQPSPESAITETVLRKAIKGGHCGIVILLLKAFPMEIRARTAPNPLLKMALINASLYGHMDIVKCLVERGVVPSPDAIDEAVKQNNDSIFRYLINALIHTFKVDGLQVAQKITEAAVPHCDLPLLKWLCKNRADRTFPGNAVQHAYHAARLGGIEIVKWLIVNSGNAMESDIMKKAVVGASELGHVDIVELLCKKKTNAKIVESWEAAAKGGHTAVLDQLLLGNPKPNKLTLRRALVAAVRANRLGTVLWLLCVGASPTDGDGKVIKFECQPFIQNLLNDFGSGL